MDPHPTPTTVPEPSPTDPTSTTSGTRVGAVDLDAVHLIPLPQPEDSAGFREIEARLAASRQVAEAGPTARIGGVEMDEVHLIPEPHLEASGAFREMTDRIQVSAAVVDSLRKRGDPQLDRLLTATLDELVAAGQLEGLLIGSDDGLVVAQSTRLASADLLAVVGILFEATVRRLEDEKMIEAVEEMSARGVQGEQVVLRYFPGLGRRFFLLAYAREQTAYRRTTTRALRRCGELLARSARLDKRPAGRTRRKPAPENPQPDSPLSLPQMQEGSQQQPTH
jgi:predicted regulator of Ras-like GTPase activity (Roadblock/LC7/MglB family)